jgi:hypothetical protein
MGEATRRSAVSRRLRTFAVRPPLSPPTAFAKLTRWVNTNRHFPDVKLAAIRRVLRDDRAPSLRPLDSLMLAMTSRGCRKHQSSSLRGALCDEAIQPFALPPGLLIIGGRFAPTRWLAMTLSGWQKIVSSSLREALAIEAILFFAPSRPRARRWNNCHLDQAAQK